MNFFRHLLWLPAAALLVLSCGPQGPEQAPDTNPDPVVPVDETIAVTGVSLSETSISLEEGTTLVLTATVAPPNATDPSVTWKSEDVSVATVSGGTVTAVGVGQTRITASAGSKSAVCKVTVTRRIYHVESVSVAPASVTLIQEEEASLTATVLPENAEDRTLSWSVEGDAGVVSLAADGFSATVRALLPGQVTVVAKAADGGVQGTCAITVEKKIIHVSSIAIDPPALSLTEEETAQLTATVLPENADDRSFIWAVTDPSVVSLEGEGNVVTLKALAGGQTTVTATAADGGLQATCTITVQALARDADFVQKVFFAYPGAVFTPEARYSDNRPATPEAWAVAAGDFLTVSPQGEVSVTGYSSSPGRVTATVGEGSLAATVWSVLGFKVGDGEPQGPDGLEFAFDLDGTTEATLTLVYRDADDWKAVPEAVLAAPASDDERIATVSRSGAAYTLRATGPGSATLSLPVGPAQITVSVSVTGKISSDGTITYPEDDYGTL